MKQSHAWLLTYPGSHGDARRTHMQLSDINVPQDNLRT